MADREHSPLGGSVAEKWLNCPGYLDAVKDLPESEAGEDAAIGSAQHALNEHCVRSGDRPEDWVGKKWLGEPAEKYKNRVYEEEAAERVHLWLDALYRLADPLIYRWEMEEKVVLSSIDPILYGSLDFGAVDTVKKHLVIADYKNGAGHKVNVSTTPQVRFYGVGMDDTLGLDIDPSWTVTYAIVQPAAEVPITEHHTTGADIIEWRGAFRAAFKRQTAEHRPRVSGPWCHWCRAGGDCPARAEAKRLAVKSEFGGPMPPSALSVQQISNVLRISGEVKSWISDVEARALELAMAGTEIPGFAVGTGRAGHRKWRDEKAAEEYLAKHLGEFAYKRELLTPAVAEKKLGKDRYAAISNLVGQEPGQPKLVPADSEAERFSKQEQARKEFTA